VLLAPALHNPKGPDMEHLEVVLILLAIVLLLKQLK
jgi:hypothetical protein